MKRPVRALIAASLLFAGGRSFAQTTATPPRADSALQAATERFEAGKRLFREGKKEGNPSKIERAYYEFKAAYAIYEGKGTLLNLVESELGTGRNVDAIRHLRRYKKAYGAPGEGSEYHGAFQAHWEAAFRSTGHIEVRAPDAMHVTVDGKDDAGITPLPDPIDVEVGPHAVEAVGAGGPVRIEIEAGPGEIATATFELPTPQANRAPSAPVVEQVPPPGGTADRSPASLAPARQPFFTPTRTWGAVAGGLGVLSLGAGVAFALSANQDADRAASLVAGLGPSGCANMQAQACSALQSARDDQGRDHTLNLVFVGVGAAALATGVALFVWPVRGAQPAVAVTPVAWARGGGLEVRGEL